MTEVRAEGAEENATVDPKAFWESLNAEGRGALLAGLGVAADEAAERVRQEWDELPEETRALVENGVDRVIETEEDAEDAASEDENPRTRRITLVVSGGVLTDVRSLPSGWQYELFDYDVQEEGKEPPEPLPQYTPKTVRVFVEGGVATVDLNTLPPRYGMHVIDRDVEGRGNPPLGPGGGCAHLSPPHIKVERPGYARDDGTRVARAVFCARDFGPRGKAPPEKRWAQKAFRPGGPGLMGWRKALPERTRRRALVKLARREGYQEAVSAIFVRANVTKDRETKRKLLADHEWLKLNRLRLRLNGKRALEAWKERLARENPLTKEEIWGVVADHVRQAVEELLEGDRYTDDIEASRNRATGALEALTQAERKKFESRWPAIDETLAWTALSDEMAEAALRELPRLEAAAAPRARANPEDDSRAIESSEMSDMETGVLEQEVLEDEGEETEAETDAPAEPSEVWAELGDDERRELLIGLGMRWSESDECVWGEWRHLEPELQALVTSGLAEVEAVENPLPTRCPGPRPPGMICREGYFREAYRRAGRRIPRKYVRPAWVPDVGAPGKTPEREKWGQVIKEGALRKYGYFIDKPAKERRAALRKSAKADSYDMTVGRLTWLKNRTKKSDPSTYRVAQADWKWMDANRKELGAKTNPAGAAANPLFGDIPNRRPTAKEALRARLGRDPTSEEVYEELQRRGELMAGNPGNPLGTVQALEDIASMRRTVERYRGAWHGIDRPSMIRDRRLFGTQASDLSAMLAGSAARYGARWTAAGVDPGDAAEMRDLVRRAGLEMRLGNVRGAERMLERVESRLRGLDRRLLRRRRARANPQGDDDKEEECASCGEEAEEAPEETPDKAGDEAPKAPEGNPLTTRGLWENLSEEERRGLLATFGTEPEDAADIAGFGWDDLGGPERTLVETALIPEENPGNPRLGPGGGCAHLRPPHIKREGYWAEREGKRYYVKPACVEDVGERGKTRKEKRWFKATRKLGWRKEMSRKEARALMRKRAKQWGYDEAVGALNGLRNVTADKETKRLMSGDLEWMARNWKALGAKTPRWPPKKRAKSNPVIVVDSVRWAA